MPWRDDASPRPRGNASPDHRPDPQFIAYLVYAAITLSVVLVLLPVFDATATDPRLQFVALLGLLSLLALIFLRLAYPHKNPWQMAEERKEESVHQEIPSAMERSAMLLRSALDGSEYSRFLAMQGLKDLLVRRLMLRRHLTRAEVESLIQDDRWLKYTLQDEDLTLLMRHDFKGASLNGEEARGLIEMMTDFDVKFPELLKKVEIFR
jgi:hypothetical protein